MRYTPDAGDVAADVLARMERTERELAARPDTVNIRGMVYPLGEDGDLASERDRDRLRAMAEEQANRTVKAGIQRYNRDSHPTQRIDMREATPNEVNEAYRQLLTEGINRAETGNTGSLGVELGDVVRNALG